jgi:tripartite ATP-independent transporter DctP family solute receptor
MKKIVSVGLFLFVAGFMVFAGGSTEGGGNAAPGDMKPMVWKFATGSAPATAETYSLLVFADKIKERTQGLITVDVYPSAQIASDTESLSLIQMGSLVGGAPNTSFLSALDPAFQVMDLPYVTGSQKELKDILDNGFGEYLSDRLIKASGIRVIAWIVKGPRIVYNHRNPVYKLADLKGMKLRIMENPIMARTMELLGVVAVPLPGSERAMAMQTRVVDGCEASFAMIWAEKHHELVKYISMTNHFVTPNTNVMDNRVLGALPADLQKLVLDTATEAGNITYEYEAKLDKDAEAGMIKAGLQVNAIDDLQPFIDAVKPVIEEYRSKIGNDTMDLFFKIKAQVKK